MTGNGGHYRAPEIVGSQCRRMPGSFSSDLITFLALRYTLWATVRRHLSPWAAMALCEAIRPGVQVDVCTLHPSRLHLPLRSGIDSRLGNNTE